MSKFFLPFYLVVLAMNPSARAQTLPPAPAELTINEGRVAPLGFHDATPSFSWKLQDSRQGATQSAYQLVAVRTPDVTLWDTGKVDSDQSVYVPYTGPALQSRDRVLWRVRYWDQEGKPSPWSQWTTFELGLLSNDDWSAEWIQQPLPPLLSEYFELLDVQYGEPATEGSALQDELQKLFAKAGRDTVKVTVGEGNPALFPPQEESPHPAKTFKVRYKRNQKEQTLTAKDGEEVVFATESTDACRASERHSTWPNSPKLPASTSPRAASSKPDSMVSPLVMTS